MRNRFHGFAATMLVGAASMMACTHGSSAPASSAPPPMQGAMQGGMHGGMHGGPGQAGMEACPMAVPGTQVMTEDTRDGIAMEFTTMSGDVADLRRRVRRMAEMHSRMQMQHGGMHEGHGGVPHPPPDDGSGMQGGTQPQGGMQPQEGQQGGMQPGIQDRTPGAGGMPAGSLASIPTDVNVIDIEGGARIELRPRDPRRIDELRASAQMHAQQMASGQCPAMGEHGHGQAIR